MSCLLQPSAGANPGFFERRGVEPYVQFCRVKLGGQFTDFKQQDKKVSVYLSFLLNVAPIMQGLNWIC